MPNSDSDNTRDGTRMTLSRPRDRPDLEALLAKARAAFDALPPEEQEAILRAQRESWVRGNIAIDRGADARPTVAAPDPAAAERAAIVAWLRNLKPPGQYDYSATAIAEMIERGDHEPPGGRDG